jgi:serine/threonine protein kinase
MREQNGPIQEQQGSIGRQRVHPFGNYDLVRRIDVGGMGEVYLARQRSAFGREVAIKIIRSDLMHDITARKRFLREAEVSAHLKHEHILPLFEFGEEQGRLFLVTPYIKGGTLGQRLQSNPLSLSETHQLFSALVQAVAYIHKRGVIHRDLKPNNILLDKDDESGQLYVRLIDFGIASLPGIIGEDAHLTTAGHEMGTIAYMAPERLDGIAAPGNDIYSLGIILNQMLTGQLPDDNSTITLPPPLDTVMKRCIAYTPADRYVDADELLRAFEYAYRTTRTTPSSVQLPVKPVAARPVTLAPAARSVTPPAPSVAHPATPPAPVARSVTPPTPPVARPVAPPIMNLDNLPDPDDFDENKPTPKRITAPPSSLARVSLPQKNTTQDRNVASPRPELILKQLSPSGNTFSRSDYNAPTTSINPLSLTGPQQVLRATNTATLGTKPQVQPRKKRKRSAPALIPIAIIVVLLIIAGAIFMALPALVTAEITISPQVHPISKIFTLTASSNVQNVDAASASVPLRSLSTTGTVSKTGPTSGKSFQCELLGIGCQKIVSDNDVNQVAQQARQDPQLAQNLHTQLQSENAMQVGDPTTTIMNGNVNPPSGTQSDTVTVSLTEQVSVHYVLNSDAQDLARTLLQQQAQEQFGSSYQLLDQMTQIGQPHLQTDAVHITVAAASLVQYRISTNQTSAMATKIKGMKLPNARALLAKQPGIDPNALNIHVSYGNTLPADARQISINTVNSATMPPVQLPT